MTNVLLEVGRYRDIAFPRGWLQNGKLPRLKTRFSLSRCAGPSSSVCLYVYVRRTDLHCRSELHCRRGSCRKVFSAYINNADRTDPTRIRGIGSEPVQYTGTETRRIGTKTNPANVASWLYSAAASPSRGGERGCNQPAGNKTCMARRTGEAADGRQTPGAVQNPPPAGPVG